MWLKLLISLIVVQSLNAECGICQPNNVACHSKDTYSICINEKAIADIITCPPDYMCTGDRLVCYPEAIAQAICTPGETEQTEPTTTTEKPKETDPNITCANLGKSGNIRNENDPTCHTYILCYTSGNGQIKGNYNTCTRSKPYFSQPHGCQAEKPEGCTEI